MLMKHLKVASCMLYLKFIAVRHVYANTCKSILHLFLQMIATLGMFLSPAERLCSRFVLYGNKSCPYSPDLFVQGFLQVRAAVFAYHYSHCSVCSLTLGICVYVFPSQNDVFAS